MNRLSRATSTALRPMTGILRSKKRKLKVPEELNEAELAEYREAFDSFDINGNGRIDVVELGSAMNLIGLRPSKERVSELIKEVDFNEDGEIDFPEFCHCLRRLTQAEKEEKTEEQDNLVRQCFEVFDQNKDGLVTEEEFRFVMRELGQFDDAFAEQIYRQVDVTGNGTIDYDEFTHFVNDYLFDENK